MSKADETPQNPLAKSMTGYKMNSRLQKIKTADLQGRSRSVFAIQESILIEAQFSTRGDEVLSDPVMGVVVKHETLGVIGGINTRMTDYHTRSALSGNAVYTCALLNPCLIQGRYTVDIWIGNRTEDLECVEDGCGFTVEPTDIYGTGIAPISVIGCVLLHADFECRQITTG
jgi:hypothetical protein